MNSALPATDLSSSFGKSKRAEGIAPPPARPPRPPARKKPATLTHDPSGATPGTPEGSQDGQEAPQSAPQPAGGAEPAAATEATQDASKASAAQQVAAPIEERTTPVPRRRGRPPTAAADTSPNGARLVLWTPLSIRTRMQAVRNQRGTLYLDQVLDALESTVDDLPDLVHQATSAPVVQGRLFERTTSAPPQSDERRVQLTINGFLRTHIDVIDALVTSTGAPSRSALINAALDATLPR